MAKKNPASAKATKAAPAKSAASDKSVAKENAEAKQKAKKKNTKNLASTGVTGKKPAPKAPTNAELEKARKLRNKRILVGVVSALLVIAFCLPASVYLISGANRKDKDEAQQEQEQTAEQQYEEQVASYEAKIKDDPSETKNYKRLGALYSGWASEIADGTISNSAYSVDELYGKSVDAYNTYIEKSNDEKPSVYKTIAQVYVDWAKKIGSGSITDSKQTVDGLYQKAISNLEIYRDKSGKESAYSAIAKTYSDWASYEVSNSVTDGVYSADQLYQMAVDTYNASMANGASDEAYLSIASLYRSWATKAKADGSILASDPAMLWTGCIGAYDSYIAAHKGDEDQGAYIDASINRADALNASGDFDGAISSLKSLAKEASDTDSKTSVLMEIAQLYEGEGDAETAEKYYIQMTEDNPDNPYVWYYYGYFLSTQEGRTDDAHDAYQKGLDADPDNEYGLADTLQMMMDYLDNGSSANGGEKEGFFKKLFGGKKSDEAASADDAEDLEFELEDDEVDE